MEYQVSDQELMEMIKAQEVLNCKYNGTNWRNTVTMGQCKFAMLDEVSEFAREISEGWKWWSKSDKKNDVSAATFELVDIIHFAALLALYRHSDDMLCKQITEHSQYTQPDMYGEYSDKHNAFTRALQRFLRSIDYTNMTESIRGLRNIIETGADLIGLKKGDVFKAYMLKNARNHKRVEGGVMEGKYDKSKETELSL